jgi:hypothetical protein
VSLGYRRTTLRINQEEFMAQTHVYKVFQKPIATIEAEINKLVSEDYELINVVPIPNNNLVAVMRKKV